MKKLKICTIVGTRPEIIRLSRIISVFDEVFNHSLIHTGQNYDYELNDVFFEDLKIRKPNTFLDAAGKNSAETIGNVIIKVDHLLEIIKPDAILVLGDTNSCMSVLPAKRRRIPIFHMEAGNRCFDLRVPEEINRRIVDHTSDINLTYSSIAREYLLREGIPPDRIIKVGSPMYEVLTYYREKIETSSILKKLQLNPKHFFLVSMHREENIEEEENFKKLTNSLNLISETYQQPVIVSTHPRTRKRIEAAGIHFSPLVQLLKPLGFCDYNKLQMEAKVVLSDSGTITEESSILKFPALNIRETHERPEGMEEAAVILIGTDPERLLQGIKMLESQGDEYMSNARIVEDYAKPNVSKKVARIIISYTDYVNKVVWKK